MSEDNQHLQERIKVLQKRLNVLELQAAKFGDLYSPPHIIIEIQELTEEIKHLQEQASHMPEDPGSSTKIDKAVQEHLSNLAQHKDTFPDINFHKAVDAVEEIFLKNDQTTPVPLHNSVEIIRVAVSFGYKLFNKGMHWECAELYLHSAKKFVSLLNRRNLKPLYRRELFLGVLRKDLLPLIRKYPIIPFEYSIEIAWNLRRILDAIIDYDKFQEGILAIETAFQIVQTPGRSAYSWELEDIIDILRMFADDLSEHKQYNYSIELYLYTAKKFHAVLFKTQKDKHDEFKALLDSYLSDIISFEKIDHRDDLQNITEQMKSIFSSFRDLIGMADV